MNYCYEILPAETFKIIRKCAGCGCEKQFVSTNKFRINGNGNRLDVWLVYQCEKCRHTYNLTIYERIKPTQMKAEEYKAFLENDEKIADLFGKNMSLMIKNRAVPVIKGIPYTIHQTKEECLDSEIIIRNPYSIKIRMDKVLADILKISRNQLKSLMKKGEVCEASDTYLVKKYHVYK